MNVWRFIPHKFMARLIHPLAVRFVAWRISRHRPANLEPLFLSE